MKNSKHFLNFLVLALFAALILPSQFCLAAGGICVYPLGDINQDKVVDLNDLAIMTGQWLQSGCDDANGWCSGADIDMSGNVDFIDYALLAADWGAVGNCSPVVIAGPNQVITLPADANLAGASVTDDGLPNPPGVVTTLWTKQSGPNDVTFGNASAVNTTASFAGPGVYVLRLTASDSDLTTYDELTITVNSGPVNQAPVVNAGPDQAIELPADANLCGASVTDDGLPNPPGAVTTQWTKVSGPNDVNFADATAVCTTAHFVQAGVYVLRLTANDSVLSTSADVNVTVYPVNQAPVVNAGIDQTITYQYPNPTNAALNGTVTDDGFPIPPGATTVQWSVTSGPAGVTFADASAAVTTATFPDAGGVFVLRLTANDGALSSYDEVTITVVGKPAWSETANYYVDGFTGSDGNPGTSNQPFATISKAATTLNGTSTKCKALIWGGGGGGRPSTQSYVGQVAPNASGTASYTDLFRRDPSSGEAIIDANGNNNGAIYSNGKAYLTFDGFSVVNSNSGWYGIYLFGDAADNITIKNCRVRNTWRYGIYDREGDNLTINNCAVYQANLIGGGYADIYIWGSTGSVTGCQITSCSIYGGGSTSGKYGIQTLGTATIDSIKNCIVTNHKMSGPYGILHDTGGGAITSITYTDNWNNGSTPYGGCSAGTGCISSDPKYVDPTNGNFGLGSGSPAHNTASDGGDMGYRLIDTAL